MEELLSAGCDKAAMDNGGKTGLMLAATKGHAAMLLLRLLAAGTPLKVRDVDGLLVGLP